MSDPSTPPPFDFPLRVRYADTDAMGVVYHGRYLEYFEVGRTEWLRSVGTAYAELERAGARLAVVEVSVRYAKPARYDDLLTIRTSLVRMTHAQIELSYQVLRGAEVLATGSTRLACLDPGGRVRRLPAELRALA